MSTTVTEIKQLAQKPRRTQEEEARLKNLINKSRDEQRQAAADEIRKGKEEASARRERARASGVDLREQFIRDNEVKFGTVEQRGMTFQNSFAKEAGQAWRTAKAGYDASVNSIADIGTSNISDTTSEVARSARGRFTLRKELEEKEKELAALKLPEQRYREAVQQQDAVIALYREQKGKWSAERAAILAQDPASISREMSLQAQILQNNINSRGDLIASIQREQAKSRAAIPDNLEEQQVVELEIKALKKEIEALDKHIKDLSGSREPSAAQIIDNFTDSITDAGEEALEDGEILRDDMGRTLLVNGQGQMQVLTPAMLQLDRPAFFPGADEAFKGFLDSLNTIVVKPLATSLNGAVAFINKSVEDFTKNFSKAFEGAGRITPDNAFPLTWGIAGSGILGNIALYVALTTTDLLHPFKQTGIIPMAIDIAQAIGPKLFTESVIRATAETSFGRGMAYRMNELSRPFRPGGAVADQMYFEGNITLEAWRQLYRYQGWPEELIDAQFKSMFSEPTDRILIQMFEDPALPAAWVRKKLKERGYDAFDTDVIAGYAERLAINRTRVAREGLIITRVREGFISEAQARDELRALKFDEEKIGKIMVVALLTRDTEFRKESLDAAKTAFRKDAISRNEFIAILTELIADPKLRKAILSHEEFRKLPKLKAS